jgi:hypothetical protein
MPRQKQPPPGLPTEADVLEFIQSSPGIVGKREIARHFDIKGGDKVGLKALLKRMEQEGKLARRQRKLIDRSWRSSASTGTARPLPNRWNGTSVRQASPRRW